MSIITINHRNSLFHCRNVLSSQEVVDFVSERLKKQSETGKLALSKICEEVKSFCDNYSLLHVIVLYTVTEL